MNAEREMPCYLSHKKVWALKIERVDGGGIVHPLDKRYGPFRAMDGWLERYHGTEADEGYYVGYDGGYSSWSPTKAFEDGYKLLAPRFVVAPNEVDSREIEALVAKGPGAVVSFTGSPPVIKPLVWQEPCRETNGCWTAKCILGTFSVAFDDGWHAELEEGLRWEWEPELDPRSYEGPSEGQRACWEFYEKSIRATLA